MAKLFSVIKWLLYITVVAVFGVLLFTLKVSNVDWLDILMKIFSAVALVCAFVNFIGMEGAHNLKASGYSLGFSLMFLLVGNLVFWLFAYPYVESFAAIWGVYIFPYALLAVTAITSGIENFKGAGQDVRIISVIGAAGVSYLVSFLPTLIDIKEYTSIIAPIIVAVLDVAALVIIIRKGYNINGDGYTLTFMDVFKGMGHVVHATTKETFSVLKAVTFPSQASLKKGILTDIEICCYNGDKSTEASYFFTNVVTKDEMASELYRKVSAEVSGFKVFCGVKDSRVNISVYANGKDTKEARKEIAFVLTNLISSKAENFRVYFKINFEIKIN